MRRVFDWIWIHWSQIDTNEALCVWKIEFANNNSNRICFFFCFLLVLYDVNGKILSKFSHWWLNDLSNFLLMCEHSTADCVHNTHRVIIVTFVRNNNVKISEPKQKRNKTHSYTTYAENALERKNPKPKKKNNFTLMCVHVKCCAWKSTKLAEYYKWVESDGKQRWIRTTNVADDTDKQYICSATNSWECHDSGGEKGNWN